MPTMILVADSKKRVTLPNARPGYSYDYQAEGEEKLILTRLAPVDSHPAAVTITKRGKFTVARTAHKISPAALKEALAEYP